MFPGTLVNWIDESNTPSTQSTPTDSSRPLFMVVSSFDKGREDLREIEGDEYFKMYGDPTFAKHGQNGIQATRLINAGARLLIKRVVANDSTLANIVVTATVTKTQTQKKNDNDQPLYYDADGNETTTVTDRPVMLTSGTIKYEAKTVENCTTFKQVYDKAIADIYDASAHRYPVIVICDNGRGVSSKAVRFNPDYYSSITLNTLIYNMNIYEGTSLVETQMCTVNPDFSFDKTSYGIDLGVSYQTDAKVVTEAFPGFVAEVADILGVSEDEAKNLDLLYCYDLKGVPLQNLSLDPDSIDFNALYGVELKSGSNGNFGTNPVNTSAWVSAISDVFLGNATSDVWDVDEHKVACVLDAAFPQNIKDAIAYYVTNRKDCVYLRDFGVGLTTMSQIIEAANVVRATYRSRYIADYFTSYTIKDPSNGKNIEVTMLYDMAAVLVNTIEYAPAIPLAGIFNNFILSNAIKGTINFTPIITPQVNQKETFDNLKINYAIFQGSACVVQSCYSSQVENTEYSYINNVINVQDVIRAIRTACPKNRYRLVSGTDLSSYADAVRVVLNNFNNRFNTLEFTYVQNKIQSVNKIFYAVIKVSFGQWAQTEIFDVYALNAANLE